MLILIGVMMGYWIRENKYRIKRFFYDFDNQCHMIIALILALPILGIVTMVMGMLVALQWPIYVGLICFAIYLVIITIIYEPWKKVKLK